MKKIDGISVLRAICTLSIFLYHIDLYNSFMPNLARGGVAVFFLITAFLAPYTTEKDTNCFFVKKVIRIIPLYWVMTILTYFASGFISEYEGVTISELVKSLLFIPCVRNVLDGGRQVRPLVGPAWTLYYNMFFYIIFCGSFKMNYKLRTIISVLITTGFGVVGMVINFQNPILKMIFSKWWFSFTCGLICFLIYKKVDFKYLKEKKVLLGTIFGLFVLFNIIFDNSQNISNVLAGISFISGILLFDCFKVARSVKFFSKISFSFYMIHYYVIIAFNKVFHANTLGLKGVLFTLMIFFVSVVTAFVAFEIFEVYVTKKIKKILKF